MYILGIESSCDECAASIVEDGVIVKSNVVATQIAKHQPFQGVVPELASRLHVELISDVVEQAIKDSGISKDKIDAVAVTSHPGLIGSLLVGVNFAKAFAYSINKPIVSVDHIMAHLYASQMVEPLEYPYIGLLVSGGHTLLAIVKSYNDFEILGSSIDDAVGEVYDKVAKYYNLGYPGGVIIDRLSKQGDDKAFSFPIPKLDSNLYRPLDMSFSGLKSAVINQKEKFLKKNKIPTNENIAASFQNTIINIVFDKVLIAIEKTAIRKVSIGGGVAANSLLRERISSLKSKDIQVSIPPLSFCTDNAVMVAGIGAKYFSDNKVADLTLAPQARVDRFKGFLKK